MILFVLITAGGWSYQVTGEVLLGVKLRLETGDLTVNVVHCRDLSVRLVSPPVVRGEKTDHSLIE